MDSSHIKQRWPWRQWNISSQGSMLPLHTLPVLNYAITAWGLAVEYQWFQASAITTSGCSSVAAFSLIFKDFFLGSRHEEPHSVMIRLIVREGIQVEPAGLAGGLLNSFMSNKHDLNHMAFNIIRSRPRRNPLKDQHVWVQICMMSLCIF